VGGLWAQVLLVDVADEEVGGRDRHDRGRHQRADADRGEREALEPRGEVLDERSGTAKFELAGLSPAAIAM
jgi:hypothetical protein